MCGRFTLREPMSVLLKRFAARLAANRDWTARFNIAPTQDVPIVRPSGDPRQRELAFVRWGLVPPWAKDPQMGSSLINARAESVAEKPAFRSAFARRRCLVPADGFYEWQVTAEKKGTRQPYLIQLRDEPLFAFAGLWETWSGTAEPLETCTVMTTTANELLRQLHERMPVILPSDVWNQWLDPETTTESAQQLLRPLPADLMMMRPVSKYVSSAKHEGPECLAEPESPPKAAQTPPPQQQRLLDGF